MFRCLGMQRKKSKSESTANDEEEPYYTKLLTPQQKKLKRSIAYSNLKTSSMNEVFENKKFKFDHRGGADRMMLSPERLVEIPRKENCSPAYDTISEICQPFENLTLGAQPTNSGLLRPNPVCGDYEVPRSKANSRLAKYRRRCNSEVFANDNVHNYDLHPRTSPTKPRRNLYVKKSDLPRRKHNLSSERAFDRKNRLPAFRKKNIVSNESLSKNGSAKGVSWRKATIKMSNEVVV